LAKITLRASIGVVASLPVEHGATNAVCRAASLNAASPTVINSSLITGFVAADAIDAESGAALTILLTGFAE
jgi:hypothetical protein